MSPCGDVPWVPPAPVDAAAARVLALAALAATCGFAIVGGAAAGGTGGIAGGAGGDDRKPIGVNSGKLLLNVRSV